MLNTYIWTYLKTDNLNNNIFPQAARMQQAKNDAAKNWRATLSGGRDQMKNNIDKVQGELREEKQQRQGGDRNKRQAGEQQAAKGVQERANKDRSVREYHFKSHMCII